MSLRSTAILLLILLVFSSGCKKKTATNNQNNHSPGPSGSTTSDPNIIPNPVAINDGSFRKLTTWMNIRIYSTADIPDSAHAEMVRIMRGMSSNRRESLYGLSNNPDFRIVIKKISQSWFSFPEFSPLYPWIQSVGEARIQGGIGPGILPWVVVTEDNLLHQGTDPYYDESVALHEFAHAVHIFPYDSNLQARATTAYEQAMAAGRWANTYAATNVYEYWAEAVQSYFNTNRHLNTPDGIHGPISNRTALCNYDPAICQLISDTFNNPSWTF